MKSQFHNGSNNLQTVCQDRIELLCKKMKRINSARKVGKIAPGMGIPKVIPPHQKRQFRCENSRKERRCPLFELSVQRDMVRRNLQRELC